MPYHRKELEATGFRKLRRETTWKQSWGYRGGTDGQSDLIIPRSTIFGEEK